MGSRAGILQYIGETKFAPGNWCGVQLDEPTGKNDGTVDGVQYVLKTRKRKISLERLVVFYWMSFILGISIALPTMVSLFRWQKYHCHHYHASHDCRVPVPRNHSIRSAPWAVLHQQIHHAYE